MGLRRAGKPQRGVNQRVRASRCHRRVHHEIDGHGAKRALLRSWLSLWEPRGKEERAGVLVVMDALKEVMVKWQGADTRFCKQPRARRSNDVVSAPHLEDEEPSVRGNGQGF
jgi:hypothetical protein